MRDYVFEVIFDADCAESCQAAPHIKHVPPRSEHGTRSSVVDIHFMSKRRRARDGAASQALQGGNVVTKNFEYIHHWPRLLQARGVQGCSRNHGARYIRIGRENSLLRAGACILTRKQFDARQLLIEISCKHKSGVGHFACSSGEMTIDPFAQRRNFRKLKERERALRRHGCAKTLARAAPF